MLNFSWIERDGIVVGNQRSSGDITAIGGMMLNRISYLHCSNSTARATNGDSNKAFFLHYLVFGREESDNSVIATNYMGCLDRSTANRGVKNYCLVTGDRRLIQWEKCRVHDEKIFCFVESIFLLAAEGYHRAQLAYKLILGQFRILISRTRSSN